MALDRECGDVASAVHVCGWNPGSRVSPTMAPKNRSEEEVQALVGAVKEHKKFKQLACYSIEALSKNLALPNTRWREYIDLAIEANAAKVVVCLGFIRACPSCSHASKIS